MKTTKTIRMIMSKLNRQRAYDKKIAATELGFSEYSLVERSEPTAAIETQEIFKKTLMANEFLLETEIGRAFLAGKELSLHEENVLRGVLFSM